jgi:flagellar hook assembly protein FlgD
VRSVFDGWQGQGTHEFRWDGRDEGGATVPAGLYFTRVSAMGASVSVRVVRLQ